MKQAKVPGGRATIMMSVRMPVEIMERLEKNRVLLYNLFGFLPTKQAVIQRALEQWFDATEKGKVKP